MRYLAAAALLLAIGCGDPTEPTNASIAGTWALQTVNGGALPYVFPGGTATNKFEIISESVTFTSAGTWTSTATSRTTINGAATNSTDSESGTYTLTGSTMTVKSGAGTDTSTATVSGNTITTSDSSGGVTLTFVFKKN
jgi:hypothetical protein